MDGVQRVCNVVQTDHRTAEPAYGHCMVLFSPELQPVVYGTVFPVVLQVKIVDEKFAVGHPAVEFPLYLYCVVPCSQQILVEGHYNGLCYCPCPTPLSQLCPIEADHCMVVFPSLAVCNSLQSDGQGCSPAACCYPRRVEGEGLTAKDRISRNHIVPEPVVCLRVRKYGGVVKDIFLIVFRLCEAAP